MAVVGLWLLLGLCGYAAISSRMMAAPDSEAQVAAAIWFTLALPLIVIVASYVAFRWRQLSAMAGLLALAPGAALVALLLLWQ